LIPGPQEPGLDLERDSHEPELHEPELHESGRHSFGAALLKPPQLRLSQVRLDALESLHNEENQLGRESDVEIVSCQCGWQNEEGVMVCWIRFTP
jgi:hypothetical protein